MIFWAAAFVTVTLAVATSANLECAGIGDVENLILSQENFTLTATWEPPLNSAGCDLVYRVTFKDNAVTQLTDLFTGETTYRFPVNLVPCSAIEVTVTPETSDGPGGTTKAAITAETRDQIAPVLHSIIPSCNEVELTWYAEPYLENMCPITHLFMTCFSVEGNFTRMKPISDETDRIFTIVLTDLIPYETYACRGHIFVSLVGFSPVSEYVEFEAVIETISNLTLTENSTHLSAIWSPPINAEECQVTYVVEYGNEWAGEFRNYTTPKPFFDLEIAAVPPCVAHHILVRAQSATGLYRNTLSDSATPLLDVVEVKDLVLTQSGANLRVEWTPPPNSQECDITYTVSFQSEVTNASLLQTTAYNSVDFNATLIPCDLVGVSVVPSFDADATIIGAKSSLGVDAREHRPPQLVSKIPSCTSVQMSWVGEARESNACPVDKFQLACTSAKGDDPTIDVVVPTGRNFDVTLKDLRPDTEYTCKGIVIAAAQNASSPPSDSVSFETNVQAVNDFSLSEVDGLVRAEWSPPLNSENCDVTYVVEVENVGHEDAVLETAKLFVDVEPVLCSKKTVTVTPVQFGSSAGVSKTGQIKPATDIGPIENLRFQNGRIEWDAPSNSGNCILTYHLTLVNHLGKNIFERLSVTYLEIDFAPCSLNEISVVAVVGDYQSEPSALTLKFDEFYVNQVQNLILTETDGLLFATWDAPPNSELCDVEYRVTFKDNAITNATSYTTTTSYEFPVALVPCSTIEVTVTALALAKASSPVSASIEAATREQTAPILHSLTTSCNEVELVWYAEPYLENMCPITHLHMTCFSEEDTFARMKPIQDKRDRIFTITLLDLIPYAVYVCNGHIFVSEVGFSPISEPVEFKAIIETISDLTLKQVGTQLRVDWLPPVNADVCEVTYEVKYENEWERELRVFSTQDTTLKIDIGLTPWCVAHHVLVTAVSAAGLRRDNLTATTVTTLNEVQVKNLALTQVNDGGLRATWDAPANSQKCGIIYEVVYQTNVQPNASSVHTTTDNYLELDVNLIPCARVQVQVTPWLDNATQNTAATSAFEVEARTHKAPLLLSKVTSCTSVDMSWIAEPFEVNACSVSKFQLVCSSKENATIIEKEPSDEWHRNFNVTITDLYPDTLYSCNAFIVAEQESSAPSDFVVFESNVEEVNDFRLREYGDVIRAEWYPPLNSDYCDVTFELVIRNYRREDIVVETSKLFLDIDPVLCSETSVTITPIQFKGGRGISQTDQIEPTINIGPVVNLRARGGKLAWDAPANSGNCIVYYNIAHEDYVGTQTLVTNETQFGFDQVPCSAHEFTVTALVEDIRSKPTALSHVVADFDLGTVKNLRFNGDRAEWDSPVDDIGVCSLSYNVVHEHNLGRHETLNLPIQSFGFILIPCTLNSITVTASADGVLGQPQTISKQTDPSTFAPVQNLQVERQPNSLRVSWEPLQIGICQVVYKIEHLVNERAHSTVVTSASAYDLEKVFCSENVITVTPHLEGQSINGSSQVSKTVTIADIGWVENLLVNQEGSSLSASWISNRASCPTSYEVVLKNREGKVLEREIVDENQHAFGFSKLQACAEYTVAVTPVLPITDERGLRGESVSTNLFANVGQVKNLSVVQSWDQLKANWEAPANSSECSLAYEVTLLDEGGEVIKVERTTNSQHVFTKADLQPCAIHQVRVAALELNVARGEAEEVRGPGLYYTHFAEIGTITNFTLTQNNRTLLAKWKPPVNSYRCSIAYELVVRDGEGTLKKVGPISDASYSLEGLGLDPCSSIEVDVTPVARKRDGVYIRGTTKNAGHLANLGAVKNLEFLEEDQLVVTWEAPAYSELCKLKYRVIIEGEDHEATTNNTFYQLKAIPCFDYSVTVIPLAQDGIAGKITAGSHSVAPVFDLTPVEGLRFDSNRFTWDRAAYFGRCTVKYSVTFANYQAPPQSVVTAENYFGFEVVPCSVNNISVSVVGAGEIGEPRLYSHRIPAPDNSVQDLRVSGERFEWNPPENTGICSVAYDVNFRAKSTNDTAEIVSTNATYFAFDAIACSSNQLSVRALVDGVPTSWVEKTYTPSPAYIGAVENLNLTNDNGTVVQWNRPLGLDLCELAYAITHKTNVDVRQYKTEAKYFALDSIPCTSNDVTVKAVWNDVVGTTSTVVYEVPSQRMPPPQYVKHSVDSTTINITWAGVSQTENACPITGIVFRVVSDLPHSIDIINVEDTPERRFTLAASGLIPGTVYTLEAQFRISPVTANSDFSERVFIQTPPVTSPGLSYALSVPQLGEEEGREVSAVVSWSATAFADLDEDVENFSLELRRSSDAEGVASETVVVPAVFNQDTYSVKIKNVKGGYTYAILVEAQSKTRSSSKSVLSFTLP